MSYLIFEHKGKSDSGKTDRWVVKNSLSNFIIGWIEWYGPFRKYAFSPVNGTTFDANCLIEIAEFLKTEMAKRVRPPCESKEPDWPSALNDPGLRGRK